MSKSTYDLIVQHIYTVAESVFLTLRKKLPKKKKKEIKRKKDLKMLKVLGDGKEEDLPLYMGLRHLLDITPVRL